MSSINLHAVSHVRDTNRHFLGKKKPFENFNRIIAAKLKSKERKPKTK